jgi:hypothetical protein
VPEGATPRTLGLHLRGEVTRSLKAGDSVVLAGVFLPEPFSGWKAMRCGDRRGSPLSQQACLHSWGSLAWPDWVGYHHCELFLLLCA